MAKRPKIDIYIKKTEQHMANIYKNLGFSHVNHKPKTQIPMAHGQNRYIKKTRYTGLFQQRLIKQQIAKIEDI